MVSPFRFTVENSRWKIAASVVVVVVVVAAAAAAA